MNILLDHGRHGKTNPSHTQTLCYIWYLMLLYIPHMKPKYILVIQPLYMYVGIFSIYTRIVPSCTIGAREFLVVFFQMNDRYYIYVHIVLI